MYRYSYFPTSSKEADAVINLLIPYGVNKDSGEIVEPEDASPGRACNCICPGCEAPLISRHSKVKRIHFAHDSRQPIANSVKDCPLSPNVALGMMLRYIAQFLKMESISLTGMPHILSKNYRDERASVEVMPSEMALISDALSSHAVSGVVYDLILMVNERSYLVDLIYPGKSEKDLPPKEYLKNIEGIFHLHADEYFKKMEQPEFRTIRYRASVIRFLLDAEKYWVYHRLHSPQAQTELNSLLCKSKPHSAPVQHQLFLPQSGSQVDNCLPRDGHGSCCSELAAYRAFSISSQQDEQ